MSSNKKMYSSAIKNMPFLFLEMRKAARLVADGTDIEAIVSLSERENIFQLEKERRRLDLARKIVLRLSVLTEEQIGVLAAESEEAAKLIAFYAVIKTDSLFFEFMQDVYAEKQRIGQADISDKDIIAFLRNKEEIAKWTDNNFTKVKNTYKFILCQAGLAVRNGTDIKIQRLILDDSLRSAFLEADEYTAAIGLEV